MKYIASSFSLQMVPKGAVLEVEANPRVFEVSLYGDEPVGKCWLDGAVSIVGHEGTALALSKLLEREISVNRQAVELWPGDILYVAQPTGRRIEYGRELGEDIELSIFRVFFHKCPECPDCRDVREAEAEIKSASAEATDARCASCGFLFSPEDAMRVSIFGGECPSCGSPDS